MFSAGSLLFESARGVSPSLVVLFAFDDVKSAAKARGLSTVTCVLLLKLVLDLLAFYSPSLSVIFPFLS